MGAATHFFGEGVVAHLIDLRGVGVSKLALGGLFLFASPASAILDPSGGAREVADGLTGFYHSGTAFDIDNAAPVIAASSLCLALTVGQLAPQDEVRWLPSVLVWATWLPVVSMAAVALYWWGLPGPWAAAAFFVLYNTGHVALRVWGFRTGLETGRDVAGRLAAARRG